MFNASAKYRTTGKGWFTQAPVFKMEEWIRRKYHIDKEDAQQMFCRDIIYTSPLFLLHLLFFNYSVPLHQRMTLDWSSFSESLSQAFLWCHIKATSKESCVKAHQIPDAVHILWLIVTVRTNMQEMYWKLDIPSEQLSS